MRIDCHVHVFAFTPGHGLISEKLLKSLTFRFGRWRLGIGGDDETMERTIEAKLADTIAQTTALDAAVVLAFDAVHDEQGNFDTANTHFYVTNDYAIELCRRHPKMLFGASVHPYRKDAVAEIERCVAAGAVLLKWLPIVQNFNPADERCAAVYEALAHFNLPLLSHTGGERSLPNLNPNVMDPALLLPALARRKSHRRPLRHAIDAIRTGLCSHVHANGPRARTFLRRHRRSVLADAIVCVCEIISR